MKFIIWGIFLISLINQYKLCECDEIEFKDDTYYIGDKCKTKITNEIGITKLITDCSHLIGAIKINPQNYIVRYEVLLPIVCCVDSTILNQTEIIDRTSPVDYYDLLAPCTVAKTGNVGVIKELRHCQSLLEDSGKGEIIPRVCNYEICKDFVCCPINPHRLNQICGLYDDPRHDIHYKSANELKCTVAETGAIGIFNFKFQCKNKTNKKTCDYEECRDIVCCPLEKDTELHGYDINFDFTEIIGDHCHEKTTNSNGVCRLTRQCPQALKQNFTLCGYDHCSEIICCPEPEADALQISENKCNNYKRFIYDRIKPLTNLIPMSEKDNTKCYFVSPAGGTKAEPKEFPSMAALGYELETNKITWDCGGTLISDFYVLTAGHCLWNSAVGHVKYVRLGALDLVDRFKSCPEDFLVESAIPHPLYTKRSVYNDIALIRLNRKVFLNPFMVPACLPQSDFKLTQFVSIGWGKTSALGEKTDHLLKIKLQFYNNTECNELYKYSINKKFEQGILEKTQICAGSRHTIQDTCPGDSGGPLLVFHEDYYRMHTIVGVTSFGKACGLIDSPGIYTKVFPYVKWIESIVWPN